MNNENFIVLIAVMTVLVLIIAFLASLGWRFVKPCTIEHAASKHLCVRSTSQNHPVRASFIVGKRKERRQNSAVQKSEHEKKERKNSIAMLLMPSLLSVGICLVCVCGMTWAWFSSAVQTPVGQTASAYYTVTVDSVTDGGMTITPTTDGYSLQAGTAYTVTLTAAGTVKECGGYCLIENAEKSSKDYTRTFAPGETITVTFTPDVAGTYTFTGVWGSIPSEVNQADILR